MKRDKYLEALEAVTNQAKTTWDMKRMVDAMMEARANLARRYEAIKRDEFAKLRGNATITR